MFFSTRKKRRAALVQFSDGGVHSDMLNSTAKLHARYCRTMKADHVVKGGGDTRGRHAYWRKVEVILETLEAGYDSVVYLDADCVIVDHSFDLFNAVPFGIGACECFDSPTEERHINAGAMFFQNGPAVREFVGIWNNHETTGKWYDQSAFNELMASRPHRDLLTILPNRYNCVPTHMEAREPFVRAFHGVPDRAPIIHDLAARTLAAL